jgi:hypothetical protein
MGLKWSASVGLVIFGIGETLACFQGEPLTRDKAVDDMR